jgi:hypothetical protein
VSAATALPGAESGRRVARVEWGLRWTVDTYFTRKGRVQLMANEKHARSCVGRAESGWYGTEVVSRTVVTHTTNWSAS